MFSWSTALLSFFVGIVGAIFGGTQTFICTGFAGIFIYLLKATGVESPFLMDTLLNTVFLPAIIFNAATVSTAFAARKYDIEGWDVNHSLIFTHDPVVMLVSGLGGLVGYLVFVFAQMIHLPADAGSFSVILKINDLRMWKDRTKANHVIDRSSQNIVDENVVLLFFAYLVKFYDSINRNKVMSCLSKDSYICLILVIINIWFYIEFVRDLKSTIDMAGATLRITIHINSNFLLIQQGCHCTQVLEGINVNGLIFRNFEDIDFFSYPGLFSNYTSF